MTGWDGTGVDPWLPQRLAAETAISEAERVLYRSWWGSFSSWIVRVHRSVLGSTVPDPNGVFTQVPLWSELMTTYVQGPVRDTVAIAYEGLFGPGYHFDARPAVVNHLDLVHNRMVRTPDQVYDVVASEIARGAGSGDSIPTIASRVSTVLTATGTDEWQNRAVTVARTECLTGDAVVESDGIRAVYRRWYEGPTVRVHMASGYQFTGTPNHPVLTPSGWMPLGLLKPGHDLVRHSGGQGLRAAGDVHIGDVPARISEIYDALAAVGVVVRSKTGEPDFHGDGVDGHVDVATTDRELLHRLEAEGAQRVDHFQFKPAHTGLVSLHRPGELLTVGGITCPPHYPQRAKPAAHRVFGDAVVGGDLSHARTSQVHLHQLLDVQVHPPGAVAVRQRSTGSLRLRRIPQRDTGLRNNSADRARVGSAPLAQHLLAVPGPVIRDHLSLVDVGADTATRLGSRRYPGVGQYGPNPAGVDADRLLNSGDALTRPVGVDHVVRVERRSFAGHVFNLFTARGWFAVGPVYSANTIGALNAGRVDAFRAVAEVLDEDMEQQWLSTVDRRCRPSHVEADLQRVPLGHPFLVGGELLDFPGDPKGSAAQTINCRCSVLLLEQGEEVDQTGRGFKDADAWWASQVESK